MNFRPQTGILLIGLLICSSGFAESLWHKLEQSPQSALLVSGATGEQIYALRPDQPLVPASTLKILTALIAIEHWGLEHRFQTDFYLDDDNSLFVQGFGDPFLISEEIDLIAAGLEQAGIRALTSIVLDTTAFGSEINIDGQSSSNNPYDAPAGAIAANFNTVFLRKQGAKIRSMETQTPLTPVARKAGNALPSGTHRVNLKHSITGAQQFAQILQSKLESRKISSGTKISFASVPATAKLIYRHENSHKLEEILAAMLKYSTNFIANQLFLMLAADSGPVTVQNSRNLVQQYIEQHFSWQGSHIEEGAGLSRKNRMSATQLVSLLDRFRPYRYLLPVNSNGMIGKTGTITGVSSYAGYLADDARSPAFALLINDADLAGSRKSILQLIKQQWTKKIVREKIRND